MSPIRVLVADDHPVVRAGIRALAGAQPDLELVGEAADGPEIKRLVAQQQPDVLLLDLNMPNLEPAALTRHLTQTYPHLRILVLTAYDDEELIINLLDAGALGYALKGELEDNLVEAIRRVAAGERWLTRSVGDALVRRAVAARADLPARGSPVELERLTEREQEVLVLLSRGASNAQIAAQLHISEHTVRSHITHVYAKLGVASRVEAARYAARHGLVDL